ncbi:ThuA domain-containing protein [Desertivirga arenae]|uniref:ThuA domain-containing protein n=1 Tax=Desertivirga arenae TaxID=2810309 RepID=UPI001A96FF7A|nr:ThuA domain-containing protein [Pedobacter sp. SYSU D00823]
MRILLILSLLIIQNIAFAGGLKKPARVLVFSKTAGFRHKSITAGKAAIMKLAKENNFIADTTESGELFTSKNLKKYSAIIFLSPTGEDLLNESQKEAFKQYIHKGGGFVGIHAATDCFYKWPWYGQLVGAYFTQHPKVQQASLQIVNRNHSATEGLPNPWSHKDEWYNFKDISSGIKVLINLDEKSYEGGKNGAEHPIAWYQDFEGGRVFYTGLGHTEESYTELEFLKHLLGGIKYAAKL